MSIFVNNRAEVRIVHQLGHQKFFPAGMPSYEAIDYECERLAATERLVVVDSEDIRKGMEKLRDQSLDRAGFQTIANQLHVPLVKEATLHGLDIATAKANLSARAGIAFFALTARMLPGLEYGVIFQTRDHDNPQIVHDVCDKIKPYDGKKAYLFDPMLATGSSAISAVEGVMAEGASGVVIVSSFASPEGVVKVSQHKSVEKVITLPLEAGLNEHGYIVGGIGATAMLGDFGDRYFC